MKNDELTTLIQSTVEGDTEARNRLFELLYDEIRDVARNFRHVGLPGQTLQPTALANEAFLKFSAGLELSRSMGLESRAVFFLTFAQVMRRILVDHWRRKTAKKRGAGALPAPVDLSELQEAPPGEFNQLDLLALDEALEDLQDFNGRWAEVVMHRYFGGRSFQEIAELLDVGLTTAKSDWTLARGWLKHRIEGRRDS